MSTQMMLFETESTQQSDGSLVVRPRKLCTGQEVDVRGACKLLGYRDKGSVYLLIETQQIRAWKPKSERGNARYRIDLQSVLEYKAARLRECG